MEKGRSRYKTYRSLVQFLIVLLGIVSFLAFDQVKNKVQEKDSITQTKPENLIPPLVQKELDRKIKKYKETILDKCYKKAMEAAEVHIDSLVSEMINFQARDTFKFPAKPVRPDLREPIRLNDSTKIEPIVRQ